MPTIQGPNSRSEAGGQVEISFVGRPSTIYNVFYPGGTAVRGSGPNDDYNLRSGAVLTNGVGVGTVLLGITDDTVFEPDDTIEYTITAQNDPTDTVSGTFTILNDDPGLTINSVSVSESAGTATLNVTLTGSFNVPVSVNYATGDGTARSGAPTATQTNDYTSVSGTLTFAPSAATSQTQTIVVPIRNDAVYEETQAFTVTLSGATNGVPISTVPGTVTISDDDPLPVISMTSFSAAEGNTGSTAFTISVVRSGATEVATTYSVSNIGGTITASGPTADYSGESVTFASGGASLNTTRVLRTVEIYVRGDSLFEGDETLSYRVDSVTNATIGTAVGTFTILNDDAGLSVAGASAIEGSSDGTTIMSFVVTRAGNLNQTTSVSYAITPGTAGAADFVGGLPSGVLNFAAGASTATIEVAVRADLEIEADENFTVTLSNPSAGTSIVTASATGTIRNDDFPIPADTSTPSTSAIPANIALFANGTTTIDASYQLPEGVTGNLAARTPTATTPINLTGNTGSQSITGNAGDNILNGFGGGDTMIGLGGNDTYLVRGPNDRAVETNGQGFDTVYSTVSYSLGEGEIEVLSTVTQTDTTPIDLIGNFATQTIVGNYGNNVLNGGSGGLDTLIGLRGNDTYAVGDSRVVIVENGGEGFDTVVASVDYALGDGVSVELLAAQDRAGTAPLALFGNELAQTIAGNEGANYLDGEGGADTLIGGGGADTFAFTTALGNGNIDTLADFTVGVDRIGLFSSIFNLGTGGLTASTLAFGSAATTADQRIIYNQATGQLFYDADGNGAAAAVQFAAVLPGLALTADSFVQLVPATTV